MTFSALGDSAVVADLGPERDEPTLARACALARALGEDPPAGVIEVVPAFTAVTVFYDPARIAGYEDLLQQLRARARAAASEDELPAGRLVELPVRYGGEDGPDLAHVAAQAGLAEEEVVALHTAPEYRVEAIGFVPGFPYLGGLSPRLRTPRRPTPRTHVPAGAVAIGGAQTGVYPLAGPGGWNLIGRTALPLFLPQADPPNLLRPGDRVRFRALAAGPEPAARQRSPEAGHDPAAQPADGWTGGNGLSVRRPGLLTLVQDGGRPGRRAAGVPAGGAADPFALRVANLLVGNAENAAALECTLAGPELEFFQDAVVAIGGAAFAELPAWRPLQVRAGETLRCGPCRSGCRAYLAISGGIEVPEVLGGRGTYPAAGLGGFRGRALRAGDALSLGAARHGPAPGPWRVDGRLLPAYASAVVLRVIPGAEAGGFGDAWRTADFAVTARSDRMGLRLSGAPLGRAAARELRSAPVAPGTVQVPPDGQPILLLADAQTIGGYPKLAHVIGADLPLAAQLRPGDTVRFSEVTLEEAHRLWRERERGLALLGEGLAQKSR